MNENISFAKSIKTEAWSIAWPVILSSISNNLVGLSDTYFLSKISNEALGGGGLAVLWLYVISALSMGWGVGIQILIARKLGEFDFVYATNVFKSLFLPTLLMAFFQFFLLFVSQFFISNLFHLKEVQSAFSDYLSIRIFDILTMCFIFALRGYFNAISRNRIVGITSIILLLINIFLNDILAFGKMGFPPMGIQGIALASVISHLVVLIIYFMYLFFILNTTFFGFNFDSVSTKSTLLLSYPMMFQNLLSIGSFFVFIKVMEYLGVTALAVSEICKNIYIFFMVSTWGYGTAASTIISRSIGEQRSYLVIPTIKLLNIENFKLASIPLLFYFLFPDLLNGLFTSDLSVLEQARVVGRIVTIALLVYSLAWIWVSAVIGIGDSKSAFVIEFLCLIIYLGYIFTMFYLTKNIYYIWMCEVIYMLFMIGMSYAYFKRGKWKFRKSNI